MTTALTEFSSLVATLYEVAANPQQWSQFVDTFYKAMGGTRGCLTAVATDPRLEKVLLEGYTASEVQHYSEYYWRHDVVLEAGLQTMTSRSHWIGPLEEVLPTGDLVRSEIYNDYYRTLDMHYASCFMLGETGAYSALGLAAWRPKSAGPFRPEQLHLVELLAPHFKQAFLLHARLIRFAGRTRQSIRLLMQLRLRSYHWQATGRYSLPPGPQKPC